MTTPPTLFTARLTLRPPRPDDRDAVCALWGDPVVTRHIGGQPLPNRQAWTNLLAMAGHWAFFGYGGFIVEDRESGGFIGQVGFQMFLRGIDPSRETLPEAGWVLAKAAHGLGYATEAVAGLLAWADADLHAATTVAIIDVDNTASIAVAQKSGYRQIARTVYNDKPILVLERRRGG